ILTVNYVVMGAQTISVAFQKPRRTKAEIVAQDFEIGLALIKVNRQGLVAAEIGAPDAVERSDEVILLGAMGPQERRATGGVVPFPRGVSGDWGFLIAPRLLSQAPNTGSGAPGRLTTPGAAAPP